LDLTPGLVVADRFRLVRTLGKGGMGSVWEAQHVSLDTPCAVKFIHEEAADSTELRNRFEREAKAAAQLRSPHVVQILDHGVWEGRPYMAMELLEGEDLAKRLRRTRPLPAPVVAAIASQVGRALTKAHAAGLVHRDLKPANIFLVRDDDREIAKVLDFGVAKATRVAATMASDGDTKTGAMLGTPFYMSPEQARGNKDIDHRADLWALSVVVYQCVTGKLPFRSEALGDLLVKIITEAPPVPSSVASVPPGFDAWWKCASDPHHEALPDGERADGRACPRARRDHPRPLRGRKQRRDPGAARRAIES
jgi:serine/threonine-protein kinase